MKKIIFILVCILTFSRSFTQEKSFFGGAEFGLSTTKLHLDSNETKYTISPAVGFSFQKQFVPKFYGGVSTMFTRKNAKTIAPTLSYQLNFIDWRLSLQYRIQPNLFIESGVAISQFIGGKAKFSNGDEFDLKDQFKHQANPYVGARFKMKNNFLSAKYYITSIMISNSTFAQKNQFSYGELTLNIPFEKKTSDNIEKASENQKKAEQDIKALKSGILLIALPESKDVKDRELNHLLTKAFSSEYNFSKYFIVDYKDIDSLRLTNRISVYEEYPFTEKQKINLENFTWFILQSGKKAIATDKDAENEVYQLKALIVSNSKGEELNYPFPYFINYTEGGMTEAIKSFEAQLQRFYYETSFNL